MELESGPGCGSTSTSNAEECSKAAASLGYSATVESINIGHAPFGCFVGHPSDSWKHTYFNIEDGQTGQHIYKSICKGRGVTQLFN